MSDALSLQVAAELDRLAGDLTQIGIALSGGGDSIALMHLTHHWAQGRVLKAATVDHDLRMGSGAEAREAGRAAQALGIPHQTLLWQRETTAGNLMAEARTARLRLLSAWAADEGLDAVLLGHTLDDQAETMLMRLARGAGVDGLSGMAPAREAFGVIWLRPMLAVGRADLRDWLGARAIDWADDPSNENTDFERVRIRKAMEVLGIPASSLAQSARNLAVARRALQDFAAEVATGAEAGQGRLSLPLGAFLRAPEEICRRLIVAALRWMSGADYPPRSEKVAHALRALANGARITLEGVILQPKNGRLTFIREPAVALRARAGLPDLQGCAIWDRRWRIEGLGRREHVAGLGYEVLAGLNWRASGLSRDEAAASPGVWLGERLIAAPLLEPLGMVVAEPLRGLPHFRAMLFSH